VPDVRENTRALRQNVCRFLEISFRPFITFFRAVTKSIFYRRWENVWPLAWSHVKYEKPRRRLIFKEYAVFSYTQKNIILLLRKVIMQFTFFLLRNRLSLTKKIFLIIILKYIYYEFFKNSSIIIMLETRIYFLLKNIIKLIEKAIFLYNKQIEFVLI